MPKQKARENRKARRKRDKRLLERLFHKRLDREILKASGKSPGYYRVEYTSPATKVVGGRRMFDVRKIGCKVVPTAKCVRLYEELARMCAGVTFELPASFFEGGAEEEE